MCNNHDLSHIEDKTLREVISKRQFVQGLAAGTVGLVATQTTGCATNPETGRRQLVGLISDSQLNQLAAESWAESKSAQKVSTDPRYTNRISQIGGRIAAGANRGDETWDYAVFDDDSRNAFVLPGNRVGFNKGMMDFADNDSQVAAVLGHEVGHVSGLHARERVSQQMATGLASQVGSALTAGGMMKRCRDLDAAMRASGQYDRATIEKCVSDANRNSQLITAALGAGLTYGVVLPFSRKHESEADLLGAKYMHAAGYDVMQSVRLWEKMAAENTNRTPEWMSTHPDPARRAEDLHNYIKEQGWA